MKTDYIADSFRRWGYLQANTDATLDRIKPIYHRDLTDVPQAEAEVWKKYYCGSIGTEFMHIYRSECCDWISEQLESPELPSLDEKYLFERLLSTETFEQYIHKRYIGAKRFSLEGIAAMIPLLDTILDQAAESGVELVMIGMAHRGRLNTLYHITKVDLEQIFASFEDIDYRSILGSGDVKYHKGATGVYKTHSGKDLEIHLASNPSHLEAINPVIAGRARARQRRLKDPEGKKVMAILLHGDAAFAGQGVTAETLNYAEVPGFSIGGTIHIVVNNMIGFTAKPDSLFSGYAATDLAKRLPIPIFHVDAQEPTAVSSVGKIATNYRTKFASDVVIDLIGYRKFGHSEVEDPTTTSPVLYEKIQKLPPLYKVFAEKIGISEDEVKEREAKATEVYKSGQAQGQARTVQPKYASLPDYWENYEGELYQPSYEVETKVSKEKIAEVTEKITSYPERFNVHPKIKKMLEQRKEMGHGKRPIDWGTAESLAFGTLLSEGIPVRLVGQDSRRGTFNHRHAALYDTVTGEDFLPLKNCLTSGARLDVYDSILSEAAAVGFEYGYSRDYPESLVIWEAQFGDFANGAQIIIDQFITAAEDKWTLPSGLVMLLPHGYEGQGPEHSSARIERFLQVAGEDNIQVCMPSTAGQYFHLLRRQVLRKWRKPLIVFTPKSILRAPAACTDVKFLSEDRFYPVLFDSAEYREAETLFICSGKIAHELRKERTKSNKQSAAVITLAQLYPFPEYDVKNALEHYSKAKKVVWVQEEPANMGALFFVRPQLERLVGDNRNFSAVRRSASASPATGSPKAHALEQQAILELAMSKAK